MSDEQHDTIRSLHVPLLDDLQPAREEKRIDLKPRRIGSHLASALANWESGRDDALIKLKSKSLKLLSDFASSGGHITLLQSNVNEGFESSWHQRCSPYLPGVFYQVIEL